MEALSGLRIVVQEGDIMHNFALANGLGAKLSLVDTQVDALRDLADGKYDCALVARITALYWIQKYGWDHLTVGTKPLLLPGYCYAVPNNNSALLAQFSEGLKILNETGEFRRIYEEWMGGYKPIAPDFFTILRYAAFVLVPLTVLLLGFLMWNRSLRKQVALRTEALRSSEEFQRAMIECSPIALYSVDIKGRVSSWNASAERVFGWAAEDVMGKPLPIHPDDVKLEIETLRRRIFDGQTIVGMEVVRLRKDGSMFDGSLSVAPIRDKNSEVIGIMGAIEDVTERKRMEAEVRASEEKYRDLFENAPIGIFRTSSEGQSLLVNTTMAHLLGADSPQEALKYYSNLGTQLYFSPERREEFLRLLKENGKVEDFEYEAKTLDGSRLWLAMNASVKERREDGSFLIEGFTSDITSRMQSEDNLRSLTARQEALLAAIPDIIMEVDVNKVYTWANPAGIEFFGSDVIGKEAADYFEGEQKTYQLVQPLFNGHEEVVYVESWQRRKDGKKRLLAWWCNVLKDKNGNPTGALSSARDITDQRVLEDQFIQAQKMESVARLAGGVAHDFNNMLSVILGYAELALDKVFPDDPLHEDLQEIQEAGRRAADITRQLLAFARRQTIAPKVLDLNEAVEGMLRMMRRLIGEDIDLAWHPHPGLGPVKMDPVQIDQILANLCVNAKDAITDVGKITMETDRVSFDEAYCADHAGFVPGDFVMLGVTDNGCGMTPETLEKIYEPFFTTKAVGQGTGLGLPTVYGIVKQNNGFINVYSEPGSGTTFKLYFPRHTAAPTEALPVELVEFPEGRGETVLVVEDDPMILAMTEKMLTSLGYQTLAASGPANALNLAAVHAGNIDLVMTDVIMPEMNGRDLSARLKEQHPDLRVLFMSGYTADVIAHHGVLEEGVRFIQKPFSRNDLAIKMREALGE